MTKHQFISANYSTLLSMYFDYLAHNQYPILHEDFDPKSLEEFSLSIFANHEFGSGPEFELTWDMADVN